MGRRYTSRIAAYESRSGTLAPAILTASDIWRVLQLADALSRAKLGFIKGFRNNNRSLSFYASVPFGRRVMEKPMSGDAGAQTPPKEKHD
jgi:hypothetical protein